MKIMIVNETSDLGGAETMAVELANALALISGNQVSFVSAPGVLVDRLDKAIKFFSIPRYQPSKIFRIFLLMRHIFKTVQPELVHSQGATIGIIASIAAKTTSREIKVVMTHHSVEFTRLPAFLANFLFKRFMDAFIAISKAKYSSFMRHGFNKERVFLTPNFVSKRALLAQATAGLAANLRGSLGIMSVEKVVVGAGRLVREKCFHVFIEQLVGAARQCPEIKIVGLILGDGPERISLQAMAEDIELPNLRIEVLGFQENVAAYLKMADVFFFPTEWKEVLPMCLIEAVTLGVPVVCSDIPGNNDIVENSYNGFLVDVREKDYSTAILNLLRSEALRKRFAVNGMAKAERLYDKDKVVTDIFAIYKSLRGG